jgi:hypothetical protein
VLATAGPRKAATPPTPAVASLLGDFVAAINAGDVTRLTAFISEHFQLEPGSPSAAQRAARFAQMHGNLGALSITGLDQLPDGVVEVSATSAVEGPLTMRMTVTSGKIQGVQVLVGG